MAKKLTKRTVDALASHGTRYDLFDSELPGFLVRVAADGSKTFAVLYRVGSGRGARKRRLTLGRFGPLTVEKAREAARLTLADVARGLDPAAERDARRAAPTVTALGEAYLDDVRARRKPVTASEYGRMWAKHIAPSLGTRLVADVTTAHIAELHRKLRDRPYLANRVLALAGAFFTYAERQGERQKRTNPAHDVEGFPERSHERFLNPNEMARLGEALAKAESAGLAPVRDRRDAKPEKAKHRTRRQREGTPVPANPFAVAALRFLVLTGWRKSEALTLRWSDVDLERGMATLPDTKTGKSVRALGAPALTILSGLPRVENNPFVFPGAKTGHPLANINPLWFAVRRAAKLEDVRLHDLRHSFASVSASNGGSLLLIGKLLGHRDHATTARYAHLLDDPVKAAADTTAGQIAGWLSGGAVASNPSASNIPELITDKSIREIEEC